MTTKKEHSQKQERKKILKSEQFKISTSSADKILWTAEEISKQLCFAVELATNYTPKFSNRQFLDADEVKRIIEEISIIRVGKVNILNIDKKELLKRLGLE